MGAFIHLRPGVSFMSTYPSLVCEVNVDGRKLLVKKKMKTKKRLRNVEQHQITHVDEVFIQLAICAFQTNLSFIYFLMFECHEFEIEFQLNLTLDSITIINHLD